MNIKQGLSTLLLTSSLMIHSQETPMLKYPFPLNSQNTKDTIYIIPGHNKVHTGYQRHGVKEEVKTLEIALNTKKLLQDKGYTVFLSREDGNNLKDGYHAEHDERLKRAREKNPHCIISIHSNSVAQTYYQGINVHFFGINYKKQFSDDKANYTPIKDVRGYYSKASKKFADSITNYIAKQTNKPARAIGTDFYILEKCWEEDKKEKKDTRIILLELGNINNPYDREIIKNRPYYYPKLIANFFK